MSEGRVVRHKPMPASEEFLRERMIDIRDACGDAQATDRPDFQRVVQLVEGMAQSALERHSDIRFKRS